MNSFTCGEYPGNTVSVSESMVKKEPKSIRIVTRAMTKLVESEPFPRTVRQLIKTTKM
jgi:hypothetical protein